VLINGAASEWSALRDWDFEWFKTRYGEVTVTVSSPPRLTISCGQEMSTLGAYIDLITSGRAGRRYLSQFNSFEQMPGLIDGIARPRYAPPERRGVPQLWLGPANTYIGFHKDNSHELDGIANLFTQIRGRKRFCLVDPDQDRLMYRLPPDGPDYWHSAIDFDREQYMATPLFLEAVVQEAIVEPGQMLYVPAHYWHSVRSLDASISVSYWWRPWKVSDLFDSLREVVLMGGDVEGFARARAGVVNVNDVDELGGVAVLGNALAHQAVQPLMAVIDVLFDAEVRELLERHGRAHATGVASSPEVA
jgi:hypothetical protein